MEMRFQTKEFKDCRTKYDDNLSACPNCGDTKVVTAREKTEDTALYQKEIENRANVVAVVATERKVLISVTGWYRCLDNCCDCAGILQRK